MIKGPVRRVLWQIIDLVLKHFKSTEAFKPLSIASVNQIIQIHITLTKTLYLRNLYLRKFMRHMLCFYMVFC